MKLCKDCVHHRGVWWFSPKCGHPSNRKINPVTGQWKYSHWSYCEVQRIGSSSINCCGEEGSWWEQRPSTLTQQIVRIFARSK